MPTSPATQTAASWLQSGQAPKDRAMEVARALALLQGKVPATPTALKTPLGPDVEMALLVRAAAENRWDLVGLLGVVASSKATVKHAKKLCFAAKQKGIDVPEIRQGQRQPVSLQAKPDPLPSFASSVDGNGGQLLFLGGWSKEDGPFCVMGMVSDKEGLLSAYYLAPTSKTQQRELLDRLKAQFRGFTAPVPDAYAAGRMRWGLDLREGQNFEGDMAEVRRVLANVEPVSELGIDLDPEDMAKLEDYLRDSRQLAQEPCFAGWLQPSQAELGQLGKTIRATVIEGDSHAAVLQGLRDTAMDSHVDQLGRDRLAARLEVTGWLLVQSQRRNPGLQALACAQALRDGRKGRDLGLLQAIADRVLSIPHLTQFHSGNSDNLVAQT
jgi:hypothetical protein